MATRSPVSALFLKSKPHQPAVVRAPRAAEKGMERIAERVTVRVEPVGEKVTRVTVTIAAEALKDGRWQAVDASPDTARAVLARIRATLS